MSAHNLKPWSLRPLGGAVLALFCMFFAGIAWLMIYALPSMRVTLLSKGLILVVALSGLGFALTLLMWRRYWSEVAWDTSFWTFVTGPAPPDAYPEAVQAWRWGRRCMHLWFLLMVSMVLIALVEALAN